MPRGAGEQTVPEMRVGVDVGGTFTDLVAWDGQDLQVVKIPSTPPEFHRAVIDAVGRVGGIGSTEFASIIHGSTVATNALLQRRGEPVAFVTTEGFRDMLLIGRQNRPKLYALRVERPRPITPSENWFTVDERIDAHGNVVEPLREDDVDRLVESIRSRGLQHVAVCLLFSFINPAHERMIARRCEAAGLTVTLSSDVLPEFREYERASTTAISASLRPTVQRYLELIERGLGNDSDRERFRLRNHTRQSGGAGDTVVSATMNLRIMHSGGGTMRAADAARHAARLVLSGPAGGVIGAAFVARDAGFRDIISYDMGGTSTDVATVLDGRPQWATRTAIDGLPIGLPMFEINTVGAGGGSIAYVDTGGALRVGPHSAGAVPGPACYGRGGSQPTVTDANVVLGRIIPDQFLGGAMRLDEDAARRAVETLARQLGKTTIETALGIVTVVESNMAHAVRAVTSRRGHDPRDFALVSFGGAGGLHACGLAGALDVAQVVVPPYCGVLSALGMIVAPPVVDGSQTVVDRADELTDDAVQDLFAQLAAKSASELPDPATEFIERFVDARFKGQSHELTVAVDRLHVRAIEQSFRAAYRAMYGHVPENRAVQIVSLRLRRVGRAVGLKLPPLQSMSGPRTTIEIDLTDRAGELCRCPAVVRAALVPGTDAPGPLLIIDAEATTYVPRPWTARLSAGGAILLRRGGASG